MIFNLDSDSEDDEDMSDWKAPGACDGDYGSLEDIEAAAAQIPPHCMDKYLVNANIKSLNKALQTYKDTIHDGYDAKFAIYADQIKRLVPQQLRDVMRDAQKSGFWRCEETYTPDPCCSSCWMNACRGPCDHSDNCENKGKARRRVDCPAYIPEMPGMVSSYTETFYMLVDEDGFYKHLMDRYGIDRSWVMLGDFTVGVYSGCAYAGEHVKECMRDHDTFFRGLPMAGTVNVVDPKQLIAPALDKNQALADTLGLMLPLAEWGAIQSETADLVDAASGTVFLTQSAVESMGQVVHVADEVAASERQQNIFFFISAVLMLIPGVGEILDAAALSAMATVIRTLVAYADAAFAVYSVVSAPPTDAAGGIMAVFDLLTAAVGVRSPRDFADAAEKRRGLQDKDMGAIPVIKGRMQEIDNLRNTCQRI